LNSKASSAAKKSFPVPAIFRWRTSAAVARREWQARRPYAALFVSTSCSCPGCSDSTGAPFGRLVREALPSRLVFSSAASCLGQLFCLPLGTLLELRL
jgi:hypothetical protein